MTPPPAAALELTGLSYLDDRILHDLDLTVTAGSRHALIGANGAGKSSLLNLIAGLAAPSRGRILLDGRDITRRTQRARARLGIARTFQTPSLIDDHTVIRNITVAARPHHPTRRQAGSATCQIIGRLGLTPIAARPVGTLSHAQRRLVDLAGALASRPRLLLLDEPSSGLDEASIALIGEILTRLQDVTVILVEHDLSLVTSVATHISELRDGQAHPLDHAALGPDATALHQGRAQGQSC
ncbi:hypothetical protein BIV57_10800 [Mangrovactinospora gilvigrisea]|uniref:ABC transporter domain-containing protein n=1 Tax=Mangrovactinospora gilvigrisea TaxID=1428644 RepID=A0A1J7BVE5_9ACTN|nr:ATP-binding cassette domain-containing protein [Mangrovactinospora gilvigrisea]OIV37449.1 hypothetical protein BIV57_10800 [Mangrovactinospora gilvigrisea]